MPTPLFTRETASAANRRRWAHDPAGLDRYVRRVVERAGALTDDQRRAVIEALTVTADEK